MPRGDRSERRRRLWGKSLLDGHVSLPASIPPSLRGGVGRREARHSQTKERCPGPDEQDKKIIVKS